MKEIDELRKILCPDSMLEKAIKILGRLYDLDNEGLTNWHPASSVVQSEEGRTILYDLHNSPLVNRGTFLIAEPSYHITSNGRKLYEQLVKSRRSTGRDIPPKEREYINALRESIPPGQASPL